MSRSLPPLANRFRQRALESHSFVTNLEQARLRLLATEHAARELPIRRVELSYELAYLKVFAQWEVFLEDAFLRYLAGYSSSLGPEPIRVKYARDLAEAKRWLYNGRDYLLWHNPDTVAKRAARWFDDGDFENVVSSALSRLEAFAHIRHRIAHANEDALMKFHSASMLLCGSRFPGGRPGLFLRQAAQSTPIQQRWLETITEELRRLAAQIAP
jgi:hypothetical protein